MGEAVIQRTFAGGELAPALHARADLAKYQTGLRTCKNFMVLRSGGVANRPGLRLVNECKTNSIAVKLIRYVSEIAGESLLIEVGVGYFRFYKNGGLVLDGGVPYEVAHPFGTSLCNYSQNGRVITLTSGAGAVPPHELIYVSLTNWIIRQVNTAPGIDAPVNVTASAGAAGTLTRRYQVTAGSEESYEESVASGVASLPLCAEPTVAAPHLIQWDAVTGAAEYYVYCDPYGNNTFGFIGTATGQNEFKDIGFTPDFAITPPLPRNPFNDVGKYPRQSATYQQRRFFANTVNDPDAVFGSRVGFISNFNVSSPLQDDDSVTFKIAGAQHNPVRHMVSLKALIILTDSGVHLVTGGGAGRPISPSSINADQETYVGVAPDINPAVVGNAVIYVQARGAIVCDLRFDKEVEGFAGRDLTLFASHLFDGYTITDMDFQQTPNSTVWCCRSDGALLGLTYLRDQEVWGWSRHTTGLYGLIEHVCVVPESNEDVVYVIVRRVVNGAFHRFIERLEAREIFNYDVDAFFVDCGLSYAGSPATTFSGLSHLEGQQVAAVADGIVIANGHEAVGDANRLVVSGGRVTLPVQPGQIAGYTNVHIGLPIPYQDIETLTLDVQGNALRDKKKKVASVALLVDKTSRTFYVGPDEAHLMPYKPTPYEGDAAEWSGRVEQALITEYNEEGRILVRVKDPVPVTILAALPNVEPGG